MSSLEVDRAPSRSQTFKDVRSGQRASEPHAPNALTGRLGVIPTGSFAATISGQRMSLLRRDDEFAEGGTGHSTRAALSLAGSQLNRR